MKNLPDVDFAVRSRLSRGDAEAWQRHAAQGSPKTYADIAQKPHSSITTLSANGNIVAEGFLRHIIPVNRISPGSASAADVYVFALSALALVSLEVTEIPENFRVLPDLPEWCRLDVSSGPVKI